MEVTTKDDGAPKTFVKREKGGAGAGSGGRAI